MLCVVLLVLIAPSTLLYSLSLHVVDVSDVDVLPYELRCACMKRAHCDNCVITANKRGEVDDIIGTECTFGVRFPKCSFYSPCVCSERFNLFYHYELLFGSYDDLTS